MEHNERILAILERIAIALEEIAGRRRPERCRAVRSSAQPRKVVASEWLTERFREQREWESGELLEAAREAGISRNALFEAKKALGLPPCRRVSTSEGNWWVWWVPEDWDWRATDVLQPESLQGEVRGQPIAPPVPLASNTGSRRDD